jgi:hypothetical protein
MTVVTRARAARKTSKGKKGPHFAKQQTTFAAANSLVV